MKSSFADRQTDRRTDICDCRVAFATEKSDFPLLRFFSHTSGRVNIEKLAFIKIKMIQDSRANLY